MKEKTTKQINLKSEKLTKEHLIELENLGLIRQLVPPRSLRENKNIDAVATIYESRPEWGAHALIAVRKNVTDIQLTRHSDNEDVIFINPNHKNCKPLFLIIARHKNEEILNKTVLSAEDFYALEIPFNEPECAVFTILKDALHCEITIDGQKEAPLFFVSEPSRMEMDTVDIAGIQLVLEK